MMGWVAKTGTVPSFSFWSDTCRLGAHSARAGATATAVLTDVAGLDVQG